MTAACSPSGCARRAASARSAAVPSMTATRRPSHATYMGSRPRSSAAPRTSARTGMSFSLTRTPTSAALAISLNGLVAGLLSATPGVRALRDATRSARTPGVADSRPATSPFSEIAKAADVGVLVSENDIPVRAEVRGAAELLGLDPMYVACEGRLVAVIEGTAADRALAALRAHPLGDPLPRIC